MCGIAGIIECTRTSLSTELVHTLLEMCDRLHHRGPDGEGFLCASEDEQLATISKSLQAERPDALVVHKVSRQTVMFGHRRLAIVDLDKKARQPMNNQSASGRLWITFNGEIYNHFELRQELESKGYKFYTDHSDTEVILHAYSEWGEDCLKKFNGMFAFVLWDQKRDAFWLVRDRLGIKPLYYTIINKTLYFASELQALLTIPKIKLEFNLTALHNFLTLHCVPAPETLLKSIYKMPAAHSVWFKDGSLGPVQRYWQPFENDPAEQLDDFEIAKKQLLTNYRRSVDFRRRADVPYGLFLSGGLDSSANLATLTGLINEPVNTCTIEFAALKRHTGHKGDAWYAKQVATLFHSSHHQNLIPEADFTDSLPSIIQRLDDPVGDLGAPFIYFLAKQAKASGVTVCMGGEGSDELFSGYRLWAKTAAFERRFSKPIYKPLFPLLSGVFSLPYLRNKRPYYSRWFKRLQQNFPVFWGGIEGHTAEMIADVLSDTANQSLAGYSSGEVIYKYYQEFKAFCSHVTPLKWMAYLDMNLRLPELLLLRFDRMTMAHSIEGRVPFLDHQLVEFAMGLPDEFKVNGDIDKYILKSSFENILTKDLIYRSKLGFDLPEYLFNTPEQNQLTNDGLDSFAVTNVFAPTNAKNVLKKGINDSNWPILLLAYWWTHTVDQKVLPLN